MGSSGASGVGLFQIFEPLKIAKIPLKLPSHKKHHFLR